MSSQEDSVEVSEEVKHFVSDILAKYHLKGPCEIKYYTGSQAGDGYSSKTYAVDISEGETVLNLFLKCTMKAHDDSPMGSVIYIIETYFYNTIYPAYKEFLVSKGVRDGFQNVPACYGNNHTKPYDFLAMENLRKKGFTLFDRFTCMNDEHLKLVLRTFAKFHAVSFAMKDQRSELHEEFCEQTPNVLVQFLPKMLSNAVEAFIKKLDANKDKDILDRCDNLGSRVFEQNQYMNSYSGDYSILTKGDYWVNNMMILYENDNREHPKDVMLVDWQCVTRASPINDFGGLFYCVASKEAVDNYKYYLQIYHEELSKRMKELGSDTEVLYPRSVLENEWRDYGLSSMGISLLLIKVMLTKSKDAPSLENDDEKKDVRNMFDDVPHDEEEYLRRAKYIVRHMIDIGVL